MQTQVILTRSQDSDFFNLYGSASSAIHKSGKKTLACSSGGHTLSKRQSPTVKNRVTIEKKSAHPLLSS